MPIAIKFRAHQGHNLLPQRACSPEGHAAAKPAKSQKTAACRFVERSRSETERDRWVGAGEKRTAEAKAAHASAGRVLFLGISHIFPLLPTYTGGESSQILPIIAASNAMHVQEENARRAKEAAAAAAAVAAAAKHAALESERRGRAMERETLVRLQAILFGK